MYDDAYLENLERFLVEAPVLDIGAFQRGGAHAKFRLILEGGVTVLAKPADGIGGDGERIVCQEAAAWVIARELGWPDLVAATVVRVVDFGEDREVLSSVQVVWPDDNLPDPPVDTFPTEDSIRAAIFDFLIDHGDRGHNWLAVPADKNTRRLKLVDHGYAFGIEGRGFSSAFYENHRGEQLSEEHLGALSRLEQPRQEMVLNQLLGAAWDEVRERAATLREQGALN